MAKKHKKYKAKDPFSSLSFVDKILYILLMLISITISLSPILLLYVIKKQISFSDPTVIATRIDDAAVFFALPFTFIFLIITFIPPLKLLEQCCPIVGSLFNKKGRSPFKTNFIPLVKDIFREFYTDKAIKVLLWLLIPSLLLCSLTLFSRVDLHEDYSVTKYNVFNQPSNSYTVDDYKELTIEVYSHSTKGGRQWGYQIKLLTEDGDEIYLKNGFFKGRDHSKTLDRMLEIKSLFTPESIKIENEENLHKVIDDIEFTITEERKLKELFSTP